MLDSFSIWTLYGASLKDGNALDLNIGVKREGLDRNTAANFVSKSDPECVTYAHAYAHVLQKAELRDNKKQNRAELKRKR